jgi:hypothetical protein
MKPTCFRCEKFGVTCDGYEDYSSAPVSRERKPSALLPRTFAGLSLYKPSSTETFETQEDYQYFLHFRHETIIDLSGIMPEYAWTQVIPHSASSELALRHLILAVSATDKARHSSSPASHSQFAMRSLFSYSNRWCCLAAKRLLLTRVFSR